MKRGNRMMTATVQAAKTNFSELLRHVENGESIVITDAEQPVAILSPIEKAPAKRIPGNDAGKVVIKSDFDDPLSAFNPGDN